jgi:hypothetical protein
MKQRHLTPRSPEWWTPERREAARQVARQQKQNPELEAKRLATYEQRYPGRIAAYDAFRAKLDAGELTEQPCDTCGGPAHAMLAFEGDPPVAVLTGWRCYPCRKAAAAK